MANKRDPMQSLYEKGCDELKDESDATDICAYCATKSRLQPALYICLICSPYGRLMCGDCNREHKKMRKFGLTHDVRDLSAPVEERGKTKDVSDALHQKNKEGESNKLKTTNVEDRMTNAHPVWLGSVEQVKKEAADIRQKLKDIRESFKHFCNPAGNLKLDKAREYFSSQNEDLYEFCLTYRRKYLELPKDKMVVMTKQYQEDQMVIARLQGDKQELERKLLDKIKAKDQALNRLVELQPRSNHEMTDLSDENRPTKLGENFKQLYEEEWTDAFEFLTEKRKQQVLPDKSAIEMLFNTLKVCHEACQETWKKQYTAFAEVVNNPSVVTPIQSGNTHMGQLNKPKMQGAYKTGRTNTSNNEIGTYSGNLDVPINEFCKQFAMEMFHHFKPSDIIRAVGTKQEIPEDISQNEHIQKFIIKCFQLCWMMLAQYPPMVMDFTTQPGIPYNQALFEVYTTRGKNVAYVVWPSVYLHKDGPLVCKGYVECIK